MLPIASQLVRDQMHHQFGLGSEPLLPTLGGARRRSGTVRPVRRGVAATLHAAGRRVDLPRAA
jgi:hypothetical protein